MSRPKRKPGVYEIRYKQWPLAEVLRATGCVNSHPVKLKGKVYPPETLLLVASSATRLYTNGGEPRWKASGWLHVRRCGWNMLWNPTTCSFERLIKWVTPLNLYTPIDFRELLRKSNVR